MASEVWRSVVAYEGLYEVSDQGRVRSLPRAGTRGIVLSPDIPKRGGYPSVRLSRDGRKVHRAVHSLVITAFVGPRPPGLECRHGNGDPTDNRLANLTWGTSTENAYDTVSHGRSNARIPECPQGHQYTEGNTYRWGGRRYCRTCNRKYTRESQRRRRAQRREERHGTGP